MKHARSRLAMAMLATFAITVTVCSGPSESGFTAAITNSIDQAGTASTLLTATDTSSSATDCTSVASPISTQQSFPCTDSTLPPSVSSSTTSSSSIGLTSGGTAAPTSATLTAQSCGPVDMVNAAATTDPMLVRGAVSYDQAGPLGSASGSLGLDGSTASAEDVASVNGALLLGTTTTQGVWFKTAASYSGGGTLSGFGSTPSDIGTEVSVDHVLWMTGTGKVGFAIKTTLGISYALSSSSYNDGSWHLAVATVTTALGLSSLALYIDGASVATAGGLTALTGFVGYWHAGWSPLAGFFGASSNYLAGKLSDAFTVYGTALSGPQIASLAGAGTQATWNTDMTSDGASNSWNLNDPGTTTFGGPYPVLAATSPCTEISMAVGGSGFCIFSLNSLTASCATPTAASLPVATWVAAGAEAFPPTALAGTTTMTTTFIRGALYNATYLPGLHLYVPVTLTERLAANWYTTFTWSAVTQQSTI